MCTRHPVRRAAADHLLDRDVLGRGRTAAQEVGVVRPVAGLEAGDGSGILGMHDQQSVELGNLGHRRVDLVAQQRRELGDTGVEQEALEAEDAEVVQRSQAAEIARHRAAPEADIDEAFAVRTAALQRQRRPVDGGRYRVQRHVEDRGDTTCGGRSRRGGETFPLGPSRLVDVHVGVDDAGDQHLVGRQGAMFGAASSTPGLGDRLDKAAAYADRRRPERAVDQHLVTGDDEVVGRS